MSTRVHRARKLRKNSTLPERKLWQLLRNRRLGGLKFRRQHPIGQFIVDFVCEERKLIVELDGNSHDDAYRYDMLRQRDLERRGYEVVRVNNEEVLDDAESVALGIAKVAGVDISDLM